MTRVVNGRQRFGAVAAATVVFVALAAAAAIADENAPQGPAPAMRLYRDPQTGVVGAPPAAAANALAAPQLPAATARQRIAQELSEEAVDVPGGGVKINLRGQFRAAMTREVTATGPAGHACTDASANPVGSSTHE